MLQTWMKAFPGVIKPSTDIPAVPAAAPALPAGPVRGPAADPGPVPRPDRPVLLRRAELLDGSGRPDQSTAAQAASQPPYYLTMQMPGYRQPQFSLTTHAGAAGAAEPGRVHGGGQQPAVAGYGTIRILQLPQDAAILGPQQVQGTFESNPTTPRSCRCSARAARGDQGQPDHAPGRRRPALRGAHLHPGRRGGTSPVPTRAERVFVFYDGRRSGDGISLPGRALAQVFSRPAERRPGRAQRHRARVGQRDRPQVPAAGRAGLRHRRRPPCAAATSPPTPRTSAQMKQALDQAQQAARPRDRAPPPGAARRPPPSRPIPPAPARHRPRSGGRPRGHGQRPGAAGGTRPARAARRCSRAARRRAYARWCGTSNAEWP